MVGLVVYRFWPLLRPRIRAALGLASVEAEVSAVELKLDANSDERLDSPGGGVAGSTPLRGGALHMSKGRPVAERAQTVALARKAQDNDEARIN